MNGSTASIAGWSPFVSLLTGITNGETGVVTEATYTGYLGRRPFTFGAVTQDGSSNGQVQNTGIIQFGTNTGTSVNIVGVGIHTASTAGALYFVIPLSLTAVPNNSQPEIQIGQLTIQLT
jgi:hypothetical protein